MDLYVDAAEEEGATTPEDDTERKETLEVKPTRPAQQFKGVAAGAFQRIPQVPEAEDHLRSALKRANRVTGNKKIKGKLQHARNLSARRLDALTKELAGPLGMVVKGFPTSRQMHPFERALLDLTLGVESYEKRLGKLNSLRKTCLEVGKSYAGKAGKAVTVREATQVMEDGFKSVEQAFQKSATSLDSVKDIARVLRKLPTVDPTTPTVALVGAPNVGKSSLVQVLSSGLPEVCNYPFTTRTVKMGHFFVDGRRHQVTDTPGLLNRKEAERNAMERLTLACLEHLPTAVIFVIDLTGECGTSLENQWAIRHRLRQGFPGKPWLDAFSKADLLPDVFAEADAMDSKSDMDGRTLSPNLVMEPAAFVTALPSALRISSTQNLGIKELKEMVLDMLVQAKAGLGGMRLTPKPSTSRGGGAGIGSASLQAHVGDQTPEPAAV